MGATGATAFANELEMEPAVGVEPTTLGLRYRCSTTELSRRQKGESTSRAKDICRACAVRAECLEFALEDVELYGVGGGLSPEERETASAGHASVADIIAADDAAFYARTEARQEREREQNRKYAAASRARVAALAVQSPQPEEAVA